MRSLWAFCAAFLAVIPPAGAVVIGGPLIRDGVEIVPSTLNEVELDRLSPAGKAPDAVFLAADIHATKGQTQGFAEGAFIPYLSVSYALTKEGAPTYKKVGLLYPVAGKGGPYYGARAEMAGPGTYHLTYIVSPPSTHGMMRQTDKAGGVSGWWKPITANWSFNYPGAQ